MNTAELALESFENVRRSADAVLDSLPDDALTWRADSDGNTIAWLIWHLARVQDDHIAKLADRPQVWSSEWAPRFGLAADETRLGYGDSVEQVAEVRPEGSAPLGEYLDAVIDATGEFLNGVGDDGEWDRVVDDSYDPPVTAGVRLASVINDDLQHVGQAAFLRGAYKRS